VGRGEFKASPDRIANKRPAAAPALIQNVENLQRRRDCRRSVAQAPAGSRAQVFAANLPHRAEKRIVAGNELPDRVWESI
jgi:hypothetical protein